MDKIQKNNKYILFILLALTLIVVIAGMVLQKSKLSLRPAANQNIVSFNKTNAPKIIVSDTLNSETASKIKFNAQKLEEFMKTAKIGSTNDFSILYYPKTTESTPSSQPKAVTISGITFNVSDKIQRGGSVFINEKTKEIEFSANISNSGDKLVVDVGILPSAFNPLTKSEKIEFLNLHFSNIMFKILNRSLTPEESLKQFAVFYNEQVKTKNVNFVDFSFD